MGEFTEGGLLLITVAGLSAVALTVLVCRREADRAIRWIFLGGLVAKIVGTSVRYFVLTEVYEGVGDARRYFFVGRDLGAIIRSGQLPEGARETGTPFMEFLAGLFYSVAPPDLFIGSMFFALLSFAGMYLFLQAFRLAVPDGNHHRYAVLVLLLPTMVFWPSSLGKDAWLVFTLGVSAYGAARTLKRVRFGYLLTLVGVAAAFAVRPHIAALFALSFAAAFLFRFRDPGVRKGAVGWIAGLLIVGAGAGFVAANFGEELPRDEFAEGSTTDQIFTETERRTETGGSAFDNRPVRGPVDLLHAMVTVPFRPFPTEAHNMQAQLSSLEGLVLLLLVLASLPRLATLPFAVLRQPYVAMATAYSLGFIIAFSNVANFGILTRQRAQLLPLFLVLLALPAAQRARDRYRAAHGPVLAVTTTDEQAALAAQATAPPVLVAAGADDPAAGAHGADRPPLHPGDHRVDLAGAASNDGGFAADVETTGPSGTSVTGLDPAAPDTRDRPDAGRGPGYGDQGPPDGRPPRRPRRDRHPPSRRRLDARRTARILLVVLLLGLPTLGAVVAWDLWTVRGALHEARSSLTAAGGALSDIDIDEARVALASADEQLATARSRSESMRWSVASVLPFAGHSVTATREVVEAASAGVDLAGIALAEGARLIGDGLDIEVVDGQIDLDPLLQAQQLVAQLPIDRLESAYEDLGSPPSGWVPDELLTGRAEVLELTESMLGTVTSARGLTTALPGFLGTEQPRRYFVGMQTSAELRGTGGLIGFWGILHLDDGRAMFGQSQVYDPEVDETDDAAGTGIDRINVLGGAYNVGVEADPAYTDRYARLLGTSSFSNINLDPDLPTTARVALDLFALRSGERLDGMILLDPLGIQGMLEATGNTLTLSDELADLLELEQPELATDEFARFVTEDIYEVLGAGRSAERNDALRELGDTALLRILDGSWDGVSMARAMAAASSDRHLQVFSEYGQEQSAFTEVGITGSLAPSETADQLAVTANNAVGGKQDVHLGHGFDLDIQLGDFGRDDGRPVISRAATLEVTVDNPLPDSGRDEYVIGNCFVEGGTNECFDGPPGWNWTWFSTWLPQQTQVADSRAGEESYPVAGPSAYRDFHVLDNFHATPPRSERSFEVDYHGWAPVTETPNGYRYEWSWRRQSKATPDLLDVSVHAPSGWRIDRVEVAGGGSGRGSGVHGDGIGLEAEVRGGVAQLTGTVTADTRLRVYLVPN